MAAQRTQHLYLTLSVAYSTGRRRKTSQPNKQILPILTKCRDVQLAKVRDARKVFTHVCTQKQDKA